MQPGEGPLHLTPMIGLTPMLEHGGMTSAYQSESQTPACHTPGAFTPKLEAYGMGMESPAYQSPSPGYGASPMYGGLNVNSPNYMGGMQSPIYFAGNAASPAYGQIRPQGAQIFSPSYAQSPNSLGPLSREGINP